MKLQTCPDLQQLKQLVEGTLNQPTEAAVEDHLSACESCRSKVEESIQSADWWQQARSSLRSSSHEMETDDSPHTLIDVLSLLGPTDDPEKIGRIAEYEVIGIIGRGGMGVVFKAFDPRLNRFVAIKTLLPHLAASGAARKRFAREAQAVAAVVDDHVMAIHCVDEWQGVPYLVMTYSRGITLQKRLSDNGPLEVREILRIGMQAAKGLAAAHAQGIVHRDIKPANIFLDQNVERVQLMDFGLARAVDDASLTRTGVLAGTPQYMSPEQARAETVDHRSDLFSLGSVMYAMCTGHAPFRAESSYSVLRLITDKEPRPIQELNSDIPEWLCRIINRLMAKQSSDRFESAREAAELLEDCLAHVQQPTSVPLPALLVPHTQRRRSVFYGTRKGVMIMLGTFGMALLGMVLWQTTAPPDISGQWTSDEWGIVILKATEPGHYEGTFTGSDKDQPAYDIIEGGGSMSSDGMGMEMQNTPPVLAKAKLGKVELKWSRFERRFNGTWRKGINRNGKLSLRTMGQEIRGAWTTNKAVKKDSDSPRLADLLWTRSGGAIDATKITSIEWEMKHVFNPAHDQMVWAVAFNPDGKTIVSAGADKRMKFWDVASGSLRSTSFRPVNCTDVAFSPDGAYLAIAGGDDGSNPPGELVLLKSVDGKEGSILEEEFVLENHESAHYSKSVAFSPDSKWLASGGSDTLVKIWSVEQRNLHIKLTGHTELVSQVAFSPDGKLLASASFDHTVKLWSVPDGNAIATLRGHEKEVRGITFSPDSKLLVSVSEDGTARAWNTSAGKPIGVMDGQGGRMFSVAFAPDGQHFATGSHGPSGVMIWDVNTQKSTSPVVLPQQEREVMSLTFSSDGQMLAIAGNWNGFQIWKRKKEVRLSGLEGPSDYPSARTTVEGSQDTEDAAISVETVPATVVNVNQKSLSGIWKTKQIISAGQVVPPDKAPGEFVFRRNQMIWKFKGKVKADDRVFDVELDFTKSPAWITLRSQDPKRPQPVLGLIDLGLIDSTGHELRIFTQRDAKGNPSTERPTAIGTGNEPGTDLMILEVKSFSVDEMRFYPIDDYVSNLIAQWKESNNEAEPSEEAIRAKTAEVGNKLAEDIDGRFGPCNVIEFDATSKTLIIDHTEQAHRKIDAFLKESIANSFASLTLPGKPVPKANAHDRAQTSSTEVALGEGPEIAELLETAAKHEEWVSKIGSVHFRAKGKNVQSEKALEVERAKLIAMGANEVVPIKSPSLLPSFEFSDEIAWDGKQVANIRKYSIGLDNSHWVWDGTQSTTFQDGTNAAYILDNEEPAGMETPLSGVCYWPFDPRFALRTKPDDNLKGFAADDFTLHTPDLFHGVRCYRLVSIDKQIALFIAVDSGLMIGKREGILTEPIVPILESLGHDVKNAEEARKLLSELEPAQLIEVRRAGEQMAKKIAADTLLNGPTLFETWVSDFQPTPLGVFPMKHDQRVSSVDADVAYESYRSELEVVELKSNEPFDSTLFEVEFRDGVTVVDNRFETPITYSYDSKMTSEDLKALVQKSLESVNELDALVGKPLPALTNLSWINSESRDNTSFDGRPLIVECWAVGCGPCRNHFATLNSLFEAGKIQVLGFHTATKDVEAITKFAQDLKLNYPIVVDTGDDSKNAFGPLPVTRMTYTILVDATGTIVAHGDLRTLLPKALEMVASNKPIAVQRQLSVDDGSRESK